MGMAIPSSLDSRVPVSEEAPDNLKRILRLNPNGCKDQVATRLAIQCFDRIQQLKPRHLDGVRSWINSGVVYIGGGALALGAVGLTGCGIYGGAKAVYGSDYLLPTLASIGLGSLVCKEVGINPLSYGAALVAAGVRDAAARAAKWSSNRDEKALEANAKESKECQKEMISQLSFVFNDLAKYLRVSYESAERGGVPQELIELKQTIDALEMKLPAVDYVLRKFELQSYEIENVTQRLKDSIRFVRSQIYDLKPNQGRRNAELIAATTTAEVSKIAVPTEIRERVAAAKASRIGVAGQMQAYGRSALVAAKTLLGTTALLGAGAASYAIYKGKFGEVLNAVMNDGGLPESLADFQKMLAIAGGIGILGATIYTTKSSVDQESSQIQTINRYVDEELGICCDGLRNIYGGITEHVLSIRDPNQRTRLFQQIESKLPLIHAEIRRLGIIDPSQIIDK